MRERSVPAHSLHRPLRGTHRIAPGPQLAAELPKDGGSEPSYWGGERGAPPTHRPPPARLPKKEVRPPEEPPRVPRLRDLPEPPGDLRPAVGDYDHLPGEPRPGQGRAMGGRLVQIAGVQQPEEP